MDIARCSASPDAWDFGAYLEELEKRAASGELTGKDPFPEDCVDMSHIDDEAGEPDPTFDYGAGEPEP